MIQENEILLLEFVGSDENDILRMLVAGKNYMKTIEKWENYGLTFFGCTHVGSVLVDGYIDSYLLKFDHN